MKNRHALFVMLAAFGACGADADCTSSEERDSSKVDDQQKVYATAQPIPTFKWSQDRDNLIQIYKMKNEARTTYAVVRAAGTGDVLWYCQSVGFPIPADTQLTNPLQRSYESAVIEQPEPNGLFSSKHTDGTYVLCVEPDGTVSPQYTESKVEVFSRPVKIDESGKVVFLGGVPSMKIEKHAQ
ncbi:MAG: hypothetical protein ACHREM_00555 [Polyangiales bacterium]